MTVLSMDQGSIPMALPLVVEMAVFVISVLVSPCLSLLSAGSAN